MLNNNGNASGLALGLVLAVAFGVGCGTDTSTDSGGGQFSPIDADAATFWDRQTTETAEFLASIVDEFNGATDGFPVKVVRSGNYGDIYRKVTASIQARTLPAMAVAYESMTAEYARSGAVVAIDDFLANPETGLSEEELADFFPALIETNTFADFGGKMYSFPFSKSVLMLYFNKRVLAEAGLTDPPATWDEFLDQCRTIKTKTGKYAIAIDVDASTMDGIIFSMGGSVFEDGKTRFDSEESIRAFQLIETLATEELAYQITPRTFNDESDFQQDKIAFTMRTSAGKASLARLMEDPGAWGMARLPQADPGDPHTVLFGSNICIFDTTAEQRDAAWAFTKYFTSTEVSVKWALTTGYLPSRKSALDHPNMDAFFSQWEYNRAPFDSLAFAKAEPNVLGWQRVRGLIENAETEVLTGVKSARQAAVDLKEKADQALAAAQ